jgi:hypothetical protein
VGVHEGTQEVLASAYYDGIAPIWQLVGADAGFGGGTVYLYAFLRNAMREHLSVDFSPDDDHRA